MNVLVTGGAGFIGSHVAGRLMNEGHAVSVLDELNDYYSPVLKRKNLEEIGLAGSSRFHRGDICDEELVANVFAV